MFWAEKRLLSEISGHAEDFKQNILNQLGFWVEANAKDNAKKH
jgi:hypothetical protein